MRAIAKYGLSGTTVGAICAKAQVSRGVINHHFGSKEELLRQTCQGLREEWAFRARDVLVESLRDPEEKLRAMIRVNFGPSVFEQEHLRVWVGFWSAISKSPALKKHSRELYKQDRETYQRAFEAIAHKRGQTIDSRRDAIPLGALMDGLWLEWCLDPKGFAPEEAEADCLDWVVRTFNRRAQPRWRGATRRRKPAGRPTRFVRTGAASRRAPTCPRSGMPVRTTQGEKRT